jgi:3-methyladenine DNA glycosylase AlkD
MDTRLAFDSETAAREIGESLRSLGTAERATQSKRYLKSDLEFYGVTVPDTRRVVTAVLRKHPGLGREEAVAWANELWREPVFDRRLAAVEVLRLAVKQLSARDLSAVETLIREARTWALVDPLATGVAGIVAQRDPSSWSRIGGWAVDDDFWVRRSALLALLPRVRVGQPDLERFDRYAEPMLSEKEFFIRKAIGWVLREISKPDPGWVADWTASHVREMPGVTFREAVRRLPAADAARLRGLRENGNIHGPTWT